MTTTDQNVLGFDPAARSAPLRNSLAALPGFTWDDAHTARVKVGSETAVITLDAAEDARFALPVAAPFDPFTALERSAGLPMNLRFALAQRQLRLVADLPGRDFAAAFRELARGVRRALSGKAGKRRARSDALSKEAVEEALRELPQREDSLVEFADGWEYRPRISGRPIAVKMNLAGNQLRCHRTVEIPGRTPVGEAAAIEALRLNSQLKHARLVAIESRIVAEANLPGNLLQPQVLSVALRAVALAERRARTPLTILSADPQVAAEYGEKFGESASNRKTS